MKEGTIPSNWTDVLKRISQSGSSDNIDPKYAWFTPYPKEVTRETPIHEPSVAPDNNNNNTLTLLHSVPHVQESPAIKDTPVSEVIKHPASWGVRNTSNLNIVHFSQQSSNSPHGMPYHEGVKGSKMPKMIDLASTIPRVSVKLDNKPRQ